MDLCSVQLMFDVIALLGFGIYFFMRKWWGVFLVTSHYSIRWVVPQFGSSETGVLEFAPSAVLLRLMWLSVHQNSWWFFSTIGATCSWTVGHVVDIEVLVGVQASTLNIDQTLRELKRLDVYHTSNIIKLTVAICK